MTAMPSIVAEIRREACPACDCKADPADPCASCPRGSWGPWMRCLPDQPAPAAPAQTSLPPAAGSGVGPVGPGTALKGMLATIGFVSDQNCHCEARARTMDQQGPDWCARNLNLIVGWLGEEAKRRHLPFIPASARLLVRGAIAISRRSHRRAASDPAFKPA